MMFFPISLPGAPSLPKFNLFSGFLNGSSNSAEIPIFYVLAEAIRVDPSSAPLVIWFNGGPGGSSLYGFFLVHGPYRVTEAADVLTYNEFSWNQYANVLYLESPLGVGFSTSKDGNFTDNDIDTAEINFNAIRDFMNRVHPNYSDREYYLSGQSYAGIYVPYLARRILIGIASGKMENTKFKGFAIGDPTFNLTTSVLTEAMHYVNYGLWPSSHTQLVLDSWSKHERGENVDETDLDSISSLLYGEVDRTIGWDSPAAYNFNEHCYTQDSREDDEYHRPTEKRSIACYGKHSLELYMNKVDVQVALHAGNNNMSAKKWSVLSPKRFAFNRDNNVLPVYDDIFKLVNGSSFRVLIYNGDMDMVKLPLHALHCAAMIAQTNSLKKHRFYRGWRFYGDFAGVRRSYRKGNITMDALTVRGAGHSVPTDLPAQAFQMINNFLFNNEKDDIDYSEPIRKRSLLINMRYLILNLTFHSLLP